MYKVTLTFDFKKRIDNEALQSIWNLVAAYSHTGQLVGEPLVTKPSRRRSIVVTAACHEQSALAVRHCSELGRKTIASLKPLLRKQIGIRCEQFVEHAAGCGCRRPGRLVFNPNVSYESSPFRCLDCGGRRPGYRLRGLEYQSFQKLANQWAGFYWTWISSGATEALAWRQLADPESELSGMAREQLRDLEKKLRIPVYYDLLCHYASRPEESPEEIACAACGRDWTTERKGWLTCAPCRLFSYPPQDRQPPEWWRPLLMHRRRRAVRP